jgi:Phosphotransferase enzyme family
MANVALHPWSEHLRGLLETGPSALAVAALLCGPTGRLIVERGHFPSIKPIQLQIRAQDDVACSQMLLGERVGAKSTDLAGTEAARLAKPRRGQRVALPFVVADPANGLVLRRPGFDTWLPGLWLRHDPVFAADWLGAQAQVSLVAHRLGKRAVLRISGPEGLRHARLRPVTSGSGSEAFDRHLALWQAVGGVETLAIPCPISFAPDIGMALFAVLPGDAPVFRGLPEFVACPSVRRAFGGLQALRVPAPHHTAADDIAILRRWAGLLANVFPDMAARVHPNLDRLQRQLIGLAALPPVPCHRDLHEGQMLLNHRQTGLLDFETLRTGDPCLDPGHLQAHLRCPHCNT